MRSINLAIPNIYESVERKLFMRVIKDLVGEGLLPKYKRLRIWDHLEASKTPGTSANKRRTSTRLWTRNELQIRVDIDKSPGPSNIKAVKTFDEPVRPCFYDENLGITFRPQYYEEVVEMTIRVRGASKSNLQLWANQIELMKQRGIDRQTHDHQFSFGLNNDSYNLIQIFHTLRERNFAHGENFATYLHNYSSNNLTEVNSAGHKRLEFAEKVLGIEGYFGDTPKIARVSTGLYEGTFSYTFTYFKPLGIVHTYPIMIHQQLVPEFLIDRNEEDYHNVYVESPLIRGFMDKGLYSPGVIRVPYMDHYPITTFPTSFSPLVTFLIFLKGEKDEVLFNLREVEDVEFDEELLDSIAEFYYNKLTIPFRGPLCLTLHRDNHLLEFDYLKVNSNLDVILTDNIDPRGVYRISLSITTAPHKVVGSSYDILQDRPRLRSALAAAMNSVRGLYGNNHMVNQYTIPNDLTNSYYYTHVLPIIHNSTPLPPKHVFDRRVPFYGRPLPTPIVPELIPENLRYYHEYRDYSNKGELLEPEIEGRPRERVVTDPRIRDLSNNWGIISNMTVLTYCGRVHRLEDLPHGYRYSNTYTPEETLRQSETGG